MICRSSSRLWRLAFAACVILGLWAGGAAAEQRIALIVGNGAYTAVPQLPNAVSDAKLIARTLSGLGFQVTQVIDADQTRMKTVIADFGRALRSNGPDTVGLFYYAGHGVQAAGFNYLLPIDSTIRDEADLDLVGVEGRWVVRQMESARNITNIVILDACRDNPFAAIGATGQGLARMDAPTGTFIAYSTAPGSVALDGVGSNSPFTAALASGMARPGLPIEQMMKQVRVDVLRATSSKQTPWDSSSLVRDFVFNQAKAPPLDTVGQPVPVAQSVPPPARPQAILPPSAPIHFSTPLTGDAPEIAGRSIEQLVRTTPAFAPIEGLPAEIWQGKKCVACHEQGWTRKALCDQGQFYVRAGETRTIRDKHPFGNGFRLALRAWADGGCQ